MPLSSHSLLVPHAPILNVLSYPFFPEVLSFLLFSFRQCVCDVNTIVCTLLPHQRKALFPRPLWPMGISFPLLLTDTLRGERVSFGSWFQRFCFMIACCVGPEVDTVRNGRNLGQRPVQFRISGLNISFTSRTQWPNFFPSDVCHLPVKLQAGDQPFSMRDLEGISDSSYSTFCFPNQTDTAKSVSYCSFFGNCLIGLFLFVDTCISFGQVLSLFVRVFLLVVLS